MSARSFDALTIYAVDRGTTVAAVVDRLRARRSAG
jgi:hypothetical protein